MLGLHDPIATIPRKYVASIAHATKQVVLELHRQRMTPKEALETLQFTLARYGVGNDYGWIGDTTWENETDLFEVSLSKSYHIQGQTPYDYSIRVCDPATNNGFLLRVSRYNAKWTIRLPDLEASGQFIPL